MTRDRAPFAVFAGVALLWTGAAGCGPHPAQPAATPSAASPAAPSEKPSGGGLPVTFNATKVGSKYIYLTKQKGNRKVYVLRADSESGLYLGQNTGRSDFVNPHVTFFAAGGKLLVADAPRGEVVERDRTVHMTGGVHAHSGDGMTLTSDQLRYDDRSETVYGEGNVDVVFPQGEELRGATLDWNLLSGHINVAGAH